MISCSWITLVLMRRRRFLRNGNRRRCRSGIVTVNGAAMTCDCCGIPFRDHERGCRGCRLSLRERHNFFLIVRHINNPLWRSNAEILRLRTWANRVLGCKICTRFQVAKRTAAIFENLAGLDVVTLRILVWY